MAKKKKIGRPLKPPEEVGIVRGVCAPRRVWDLLYRIGNKNASAGVRVAALAYKEEIAYRKLEDGSFVPIDQGEGE